jgi:hypothetical protein
MPPSPRDGRTRTAAGFSRHSRMATPMAWIGATQGGTTVTCAFGGHYANRQARFRQAIMPTPNAQTFALHARMANMRYQDRRQAVSRRPISGGSVSVLLDHSLSLTVMMSIDVA